MSQQLFGNSMPSDGNGAVVHQTFLSPAEGAGYVGVFGEVSFVICAGYMLGRVHDGVCPGGVAVFPLFNPSTDFTTLYDGLAPDPVAPVAPEGTGGVKAKTAETPAPVSPPVPPAGPVVNKAGGTGSLVIPK